MDVKLRLGELLVFVPDLAKARRFYVEMLGLEEGSRSDEHVRLRGGDFGLTLFPCDADAPPLDYAREAGSSITFEVESLEEIIASLRDGGVEILHETPEEGPLGRYVAFRDPFGIVHELIERADSAGSS